MGVDAEILIRRVPRSRVTDAWLKEMSWRLCESIGANNFFITDGLPPAEYEKASEAWTAAFEAHPLHAVFITEKEWHKKQTEYGDKIRADVGRPPEQLRLAIEVCGTRYREEGDAVPGAVYVQDGDDIGADDGECLLELNLAGRYYGEGYERGDILTYCAIAEWLEVNIPGCEIWYGGDSSGVCAERFDAKRRAALRRHLYSGEGRDYYKSFGSIEPKPAVTPSACGLCPAGTYRGVQCGFGGNGNFAAFSCAGCGKKVRTDDGGKTWAEEKP